MCKLLHHDNNKDDSHKDDAKAIAIPQVFSKNSLAKKERNVGSMFC